jgi:transcriptional regulator with XRE-family HTH domain
MSVKLHYTPSRQTEEYNRRVGERLRIFRKLRNLEQCDVYPKLGYKSSGAGSLIEAGRRGLNKTKLRAAAVILETYPEILTDERELSRDELIALDTFFKIIKNPKHPKHKVLCQLLNHNA